MQVGIGDPHCVVFHLPGNSSNIHVREPINQSSATEGTFLIDSGLSEELLVALLKLLKKYLMDAVKIVDMTSQALRVSKESLEALFFFSSFQICWSL